MKYSFQIMVSGTINVADDDVNAGATASQKVAGVMQHVPSLMGGDTDLTLDTMTSGIKAAPDFGMDGTMSPIGVAK